MRRSMLTLMISAVCVGSTAEAATIRFSSDPFAGSTAPTTPGRQIVGGEPSVPFDTATDVFVFGQLIFGLDNPLSFASGPAASLPPGGADVIVLQEFGPPMAAGLAATLIANQVTTAGPGVFVYFNTGLSVPRLVYSTNLDDETADLKILARMINLDQGSMTEFSAGNFAVPEPSVLLLLGLAGLAAARRRF